MRCEVFHLIFYTSSFRSPAANEPPRAWSAGPRFREGVLDVANHLTSLLICSDPSPDIQPLCFRGFRSSLFLSRVHIAIINPWLQADVPTALYLLLEIALLLLRFLLRSSPPPLCLFSSPQFLFAFPGLPWDTCSSTFVIFCVVLERSSTCFRPFVKAGLFRSREPSLSLLYEDVPLSPSPLAVLRERAARVTISSA